jgi:hypothetical protein
MIRAVKVKCSLLINNPAAGRITRTAGRKATRILLWLGHGRFSRRDAELDRRPQQCVGFHKPAAGAIAGLSTCRCQPRPLRTACAGVQWEPLRQGTVDCVTCNWVEALRCPPRAATVRLASRLSLIASANIAVRPIRMRRDGSATWGRPFRCDRRRGDLQPSPGPQ